MKKLFSRIMVITMLLFPFIIIAQTTHTVEVGPGMIYTPAILTIEEGDIVSWVSLGGTHDVNFDINSQTGESFGNPDEIANGALFLSSDYANFVTGANFVIDGGQSV